MYSGKVSAADANYEKIIRGSVVSLNEAGEIVLGLGAYSASFCPMPMFSKKNIYDPDVMTGAKGATTGEILASSTVGGILPAYVATGAFEMETSTFAAGEYTINMPLTASADGKVTPATEGVYGSAAVVGIVSRKPFRSQASMNVNGTGANRLCFWTVFFPPKAQ